MPTPAASGPVTSYSQSGINDIDALSFPGLMPLRWGNANGTPLALTYSFPSNGASWAANYAFSPMNTVAGGFIPFNATQVAAARTAIAKWGEVANLGLTEVTETPTSVGDIRAAFSTLPSTLSGISNNPQSGANGGDVWINKSYATSAYSVGSFEYMILMHEFGHALGLKHPFDQTPTLSTATDTQQYTIMSYTQGTKYPTNVFPQTPMVDDIRTIQYIYGANMTTRTGNDTYSFSSIPPVIMTIWDAGGTDTLSASSYTSACTLDLREGHYSSIALVENIGIAYGVTIENATGGSGNDTLIGNSANNILDGGAGSDTVVYSGVRANYVLTATTSVYSISSTADGTDTLTNIETVKFSDQTVTLALPDTTKPTVVSASPANASTSVGVTDNFVFTFSEPVARGTGSITLSEASGAVIAAYDVATSTNLSISGSTLTINPTVDLINGTAYKIEFAPGSFKDLGGNQFSGVFDYHYSFSSVDYPPPVGTTGNDILNGTIANDTINGLSGNDTITGRAGNDNIDGGTGIDTAVYSGNRANYTLSKTGGTTIIKALSGSDGLDALTNVERIKFSDVNLAIDVSGNAGTVAKILGAVFGADAIHNKQYVGIGLSYLDGGMSYEALTALAIGAAGASTPQQVVNLLWTNVVGTPPSSADAKPFIDMLNTGTSIGALGVLAADTELNTSHINLVGLQQTGLEYTI